MEKLTTAELWEIRTALLDWSDCYEGTNLHQAAETALLKVTVELAERGE